MEWWFHVLAVSAIVALGSVNHDLYKWTGESPSIGTIAAKDESMAAHQKMGIWPFVLVLLVVSGFGEVGSLVTILLGLAVYWAVIPMLFWVPQSIMDDKSFNMLWYDILTFNVAVSLGYTVAVRSSWPLLPPHTDIPIFLGTLVIVYLATGWSATYDSPA